MLVSCRFRLLPSGGATVDMQLKEAIFSQVKKEPYAQALKMELVALEEGFSAVCQAVAYRTGKPLPFV